MLNPAGLRVMLGKFALRYANDIGIVIEDYGAGTGRTLVQRDHVFFSVIIDSIVLP